MFYNYSELFFHPLSPDRKEDVYLLLIKCRATKVDTSTYLLPVVNESLHTFLYEDDVGRFNA